MSELLDKQVNVQKKTSGIHASSWKPTKKVCDENERQKQRNKKKQCARKNYIHGRKYFIGLGDIKKCMPRYIMAHFIMIINNITIILSEYNLKNKVYKSYSSDQVIS